MTVDDVKAELARGQAEAVRILDAWSRAKPGRMVALNHWLDGRFEILIGDDYRGRFGDRRYFLGDSPEAARANAAEAIRFEIAEGEPQE